MHCGTIGSWQSAATSEIVKALLVTSLTHVSGAITSVLTFTFYLYVPQSRLKPSQGVLPYEVAYEVWSHKLESLCYPMAKAP